MVTDDYRELVRVAIRRLEAKPRLTREEELRLHTLYNEFDRLTRKR